MAYADDIAPLYRHCLNVQNLIDIHCMCCIQ